MAIDPPHQIVLTFLTEEAITSMREVALDALPKKHRLTARGIVERFETELAYREAKHLTGVLAATVEKNLVGHPSVVIDSESYRLASVVLATLTELEDRLQFREHTIPLSLQEQRSQEARRRLEECRQILESMTDDERTALLSRHRIKA